MDLGRGTSAVHQEVHIRHEAEPMVQSQSGERNLRADSRVIEAEADSRNGQIRQSETELHLGNTLSDRSDNAERRRDEALRGNERESYGAYSELRGEEENVKGVSGADGERTVYSNATSCASIYSRSRGRNTAYNGLCNIK